MLKIVEFPEGSVEFEGTAAGLLHCLRVSKGCYLQDEMIDSETASEERDRPPVVLLRNQSADCDERHEHLTGFASQLNIAAAVAAAVAAENSRMHSGEVLVVASEYLVARDRSQAVVADERLQPADSEVAAAAVAAGSSDQAEEKKKWALLRHLHLFLLLLLRRHPLLPVAAAVVVGIKNAVVAAAQTLPGFADVVAAAQHEHGMLAELVQPLPQHCRCCCCCCLNEKPLDILLHCSGRCCLNRLELD